MWARTLDASAIAIRALSFAVFISSGRMRFRLEVGRCFVLVVPLFERLEIPLDGFSVLDGCRN